ncbi:tyrosine-protein phosphatase oca6-related [Anaeramoeba ignava]|uniref:Tyrosine-protein phosphatase oca6-related n=1 Tax=Anaeramoeba ignava TaxID=1746090 RepID=A0A9Q0RE89_ANAIG|nr:tyrosine-protein phosphatase oca6-related [Anaeramoeba ignava]
MTDKNLQESHQPKDNKFHLLIPPFRFAIVEEGVYRGAYPTPNNFRFLKRLRLKTILSLTPKEPTKELTEFCKQQKITSIFVETPKYDESVVFSSRQVAKNLEYLIDPKNFPIYIHCLNGINNTGLIIMCLRKLQNWSSSSIFFEFRRYSKRGGESTDEKQFVEEFRSKIQIPNSIPSWLWTGKFIKNHPTIRIVLSEKILTEIQKDLEQKENEKKQHDEREIEQDQNIEDDEDDDDDDDNDDDDYDNDSSIIDDINDFYSSPFDHIESGDEIDRRFFDDHEELKKFNSNHDYLSPEKKPFFCFPDFESLNTSQNYSDHSQNSKYYHQLLSHFSHNLSLESLDLELKFIEKNLDSKRPITSPSFFKRFHFELNEKISSPSKFFSSDSFDLTQSQKIESTSSKSNLRFGKDIVINNQNLKLDEDEKEKEKEKENLSNLSDEKNKNDDQNNNNHN